MERRIHQIHNEQILEGLPAGLLKFYHFFGQRDRLDLAGGLGGLAVATQNGGNLERVHFSLGFQFWEEEGDVMIIDKSEREVN